MSATMHSVRNDGQADGETDDSNMTIADHTARAAVRAAKNGKEWNEGM